MKLPERSVGRPVTVLVATATAIVFGWISLSRLPVELLPDLSYPSLTVQTGYPDAAPLSVEQFVTRPIEEAVGVVPGVRDMRSESRAGLSEVTLEFEWDEPMEFAAMEVRERLGTVELPREAERPRVLRFDPSLDPIVRLALRGERPLDELWQVADRWVKRRFEAVKGVAAAKVRGGLEPEVVVEADEDRLAALGLTLDDLATALRADNVNRPGGNLRDYGAVYLVRTLHEFEDLDQVRRTIVRETDAGRVRVEDVAVVRRGHRDREVVTRSNGREVIEIALHREGSSNTLAVAAAIRDELERLRGELAGDLALDLLADQSVYIAAAIDEVWNAAWIGALLAILVLYFFLRDPRATAIVAVTIPVSVLATFLPMGWLGVDLNLMSLGGLALGVGMLVDNSIVVLEAIDRRRAAGVAPREAAGQGAGEVAGAVTASTLTTICVFLPIVFVEGIAGQLFRDLAITVCLSLVASLAASLTLIPSLAAWQARATLVESTLFRWDRGGGTADRPWTLRVGRIELPPVGDGEHAFSRILTVLLFPLRVAVAGLALVVAAAWWVLRRSFDLAAWPFARLVESLGRAYARAFVAVLRHRRLVVAGTAALFVLSLLAARDLGRELVPSLAQGEFALRLRLPEGTPLATTVDVVERIESALAPGSTAASTAPPAGREDAPGGRYARVFSIAGSLPSAASGRREQGENLAQVDLVLAPGRSEAAAIEAARAVLSRFPRADVELVHPSVLTMEPPVALHVFADDLDALDTASATVLRALRGRPDLRDVASTAEAGSPEIRIVLDREQAGVRGVSAEELSRSLQRQIQGEVVGQFREGEERVDIRLRAAEPFRARASDVADLRVRLPDGTAVPISALAEVAVERGPAAVHRAAGSRAARVTAQVAGVDLGAALGGVRESLRTLALPSDATVELAGQDRELRLSFDSLRLALGLAVFLVYVVMAMQFESLVHPFVILIAVPMGLIGVVAALLATGASISVLVLIGVVMLSGIVVNNAIVLVDAINRRRREGRPLDEAIRGAGRERLRPILMTTATTVLALLPLAWGLGAGDELRAPLATTVIGGLLAGTLLTLFVTPCLYRILSSAGVAVRERRPDAAGAAADEVVP